MQPEKPYCIPGGGCHVTAYPFPGFGGGGWGGGNGWGGGDASTSNDAQSSDPRVWCAEFPGVAWEQSQGQCDVYSPPQLEVNGCGTTGGVPVPDHLVSGVSPALAAYFGPMFTAACDLHDLCYGTAGSNKQQCDEGLYDDMIAAALQQIPTYLHAVFIPAAIGQAWAYSRFLQWEWVEPWTSQPAFDSAQAEARCRGDAAAYDNVCR